MGVAISRAAELGIRDVALPSAGNAGGAAAVYAARKAIVESIMASSEDMAATSPDAVSAMQTLARFVESPGQTLAITFTPRGKVPALQLFQMLKTDPLAALAQFRIEASTRL